MASQYQPFNTALNYGRSMDLAPKPVAKDSSAYYFLYVMLGICFGCCCIMMINLIFFTYAGWSADTEEGLQITGVVIGSLCCVSILGFIMFSWGNGQTKSNDIEMMNVK